MPRFGNYRLFFAWSAGNNLAHHCRNLICPIIWSALQVCRPTPALRKAGETISRHWLNDLKSKNSFADFYVDILDYLGIFRTLRITIRHTGSYPCSCRNNFHRFKTDAKIPPVTSHSLPVDNSKLLLSSLLFYANTFYNDKWEIYRANSGGLYGYGS